MARQRRNRFGFYFTMGGHRVPQIFKADMVTSPAFSMIHWCSRRSMVGMQSFRVPGWTNIASLLGCRLRSCRSRAIVSVLREICCVSPVFEPALYHTP